MAIWNERIRQKRLEKGITLAQIADSLNVTEATAQRYESGSIKTVPYEHICTYAKLFNCTPQYLMGWVNEDEDVLDYFYNILEKIVDALENNGFDVFPSNSFKDETLIIKSKDGKTIKSTESELVREYEKIQYQNINFDVKMLINKKLFNTTTETDLFIRLFESFGYKITLNEQTVDISFYGEHFLLKKIDFTEMLERCHKDFSYNINRLIDSYRQKERAMLNAAHERTDIEVTDDMKKNDDDIMDSDKF